MPWVVSYLVLSRNQRHREQRPPATGNLAHFPPAGKWLERDDQGWSCRPSSRIRLRKRKASPCVQDSSVSPRISTLPAATRCPVATSRMTILMFRIRFDTFCTHPTTENVAPAFRAASTSHPSHVHQ